MRITLYGGSFDPPHLGHVLASIVVLSATQAEEVWWIPTARHNFGKPLSSLDDRMRWCTLAIAPLGPRVRLVDPPEGPDGTTRTMEQVDYFRETFPMHEFRLLVGADLFDDLRNFHRGEELLRSVGIDVVGRGLDIREETRQPGDNIHFIPITLPNISSTVIRRRLANGESVEGLVPSELIPLLKQ